jgi:enoyl-CoA hydratase
MPDYKYLLYETLDEGRIVRIMLNRPGSRNAQHRGLLVELNDAFLTAEADDEVRVVILGGTGPMFSSGHDLGSKESREEMTPGPTMHPTRVINGATRKGAESLMLQEWHYFFENTRRWRNLRKITIGQAHGDVYAAGLMLLWACDLIVAAEGTRFADVVGTRLGMCGVEYFAHPWEFGPRKAKELLLTGDSVDADEAHRLGMVTKVFPDDQLTDHDVAAHKGVGEPERRQHGLLQRAQRLLHAARAQPLALGPGQREPLPGGARGLGHPQLEGGAADCAGAQGQGAGRVGPDTVSVE